MIKGQLLRELRRGRLFLWNRRGHQLHASIDAERKRGGLGITPQLVRARPGREAERITAGFVETIFLRAAGRIEAMKAEREATLMREGAAEAAMRRIHDPIVIMDDETPPVSDAEREEEEEQAGAPDRAAMRSPWSSRHASHVAALCCRWKLPPSSTERPSPIAGSTSCPPKTATGLAIRGR